MRDPGGPKHAAGRPRQNDYPTRQVAAGWPRQDDYSTRQVTENGQSVGAWGEPTYQPRAPKPGNAKIGLSGNGRRWLWLIVGFIAVSMIAVLLVVVNNKPGATISAGDSKAHCIVLQFPHGIMSQSEISAASDLTGTTYNCVETFANGSPTWADWETPWMFSTPSDGWDSWLAASPAHQVVLSIDLIPQSVANSKNPLSWEQPCATGGYDQYATALARNLMSYGAGNVVIRLGAEANGNWEDDYVGSTGAEMADWAKCFDNEVTAMRSVSGTHFLFVWNPNACTSNLPLSKWYPGDAYVDIVGIDAYDEDCSTNKTASQEGWAAFSTNHADNTVNDLDFPSIANMEAFSETHGKPMSFPEWGLYEGKPDDASYVDDMGQMFTSKDFSFEGYYDSDDRGVVPLGSKIPSATTAYSQAFK
jgi:hypothetical protein